MVRIDKIKYFNIYSNKDGSYIVHNTHKEFANGHTHINNYNTCKYIIYLVLYKRLPKKNHLSLYLIDSLIRISDDEPYTNKIKKFKKEQQMKKNR